MKFEHLKAKDFKQLMGDHEDDQINRIHLILSFIDFNFSPDRVTEELQLQPLSTGVKGEEYLLSDGIRKKVRDCNYWEYEWKIISNEFIGDFITRFIREIIKPRVTAIKNLNSNCITRFTIVQYYYTGANIGLGLEKEEVQILAAIDAEVDIDLYALSEK